MIVRSILPLVLLFAASGAAVQEGPEKEEAVLFTPPGFDTPGEPATAPVRGSGEIDIVVRDASTGAPTFCRMNVVGSDGNFYRPEKNALAEFGFTGNWPKKGRGNRRGKGPFRYTGWLFYSGGRARVRVPAGDARVEVWKGYEFRPRTATVRVRPGETRRAEITLSRDVPMETAGYYSGDPHLHFRRTTQAEERIIFDLMEAEDIGYGSVLAYNNPPGSYTGRMESMVVPQRRLGKGSAAARGNYRIASGQEYRSRTYGHLNLYLRDDLVLKGRKTNADDWPLYGRLGLETRRQGGFAFYAHGGYAQSIYADFVQRAVNGVELLQFGVYRGIGLEDWYRILNIGYRFPIVGGSDYPPCRRLGDCRTYVHRESRPTLEEWLRGAAEGRSFVTTGPLLLLEVDGRKPGAVLEKKGAGPHALKVRVRVRSLVAPVHEVHLIVNGSVVHTERIPHRKAVDGEVVVETRIELPRSGWIAARAFGTAPSGAPDAESHTNPVYVTFDGRPPYDRASLDALLAKLDGQIARHRTRTFPEKAQVLAYFDRSRDILLGIRGGGGLKKFPTDLAGTATDRFDPSTRTHSDRELKEYLKPVPPLSPEEALKAIETTAGFRLELVAHEPRVVDPVAACFDEDGNLYVAEMRDYPYRPRPGRPPLGTVRYLRDSDGDGRFDQSHVFAEGLLWAAGVVPWKGGIFVAAPPDVWYLKDSDGDHRADIRRKVFTGFGTQNQQGMLNNLTFGLDHKVYGSTSSNGGKIRPGNDPAAPPIDIRRKDFRFDPVTSSFEAISGSAQFGNSFDDWGNRFLCTESHPLKHVVLPRRYLARNPYLPVPSAIHDIAGTSVPIHRISPIERWRQIRSSRRIAHGERSATSSGASHHVVDAAAGVTVYRGGAYPENYAGNIFVSDAQNNLVHRRILEPSGPSFRSRRGDTGTEFLRSHDAWFRPVNLVNAPDGTLWVLDMCREIIESVHIPSDVVKHLDLKNGRDRGRIYRIVPPGFAPAPSPRLGEAGIPDLVASLESPHGWRRDTAHRLIFERQDAAAVAPLRRLLNRSPSPQARVHALWSLRGLKALADSDLEAALDDSSAWVRVHAIRLAEPRLNGRARLREKVLARADDLDARVALQLAFTLGEIEDRSPVVALSKVAKRHARDRWIRAAVLSSSAGTADRLLAGFLNDDRFSRSESGARLIEELAFVVGSRNRAEEVERVLSALTARGTAALQDRVLPRLGAALRRAGSGPADTAMVRRHLARARARAADPAASMKLRVRSVEALAFDASDVTRRDLVSLLDPRRPGELQLAAIRALAGSDDPEIAEILIARWSGFLPPVRSEALGVLLSRATWTRSLLTAAEKGAIPAAQVELSRRDRLLDHRDKEIARRAQRLFAGEVLPSRQEVLAKFLPALKLKGVAGRGEKIFLKSCKICHKVADQGIVLGPDLTSNASRDPEALLTNVLDPNRYVPPQYVQYVVRTRDGRILDGMIAAETATSITLRRQEGAQDVVLRKDIDRLKSTGKSVMPEGLEKGLTPQDMADLLAYLGSIAGTRPPSPARLDIGTRPGLSEPED